MSTGDQTVQVVHDEIDNAVRVLPDQVSALGDTRKLLTSRQVPAGAFGDVDASAQVGETHAGNVARTDRGLGDSSSRLDEIIGKVRGTGASLREFDDKQSGNQQQQAQVLAQVTDTRRQPLPGPVVTLPNGKTFEVKPGDKHIVPDRSDVELTDGTHIGPNSGRARWQRSDGADIRKVPEEEIPAW